MDGYADHAVSLDEAKCDGADPSLEHEAARASGDGVTCPLCMVDDILHLNGVFFCRCGFRIDCKVSTAMSVCTGEAGGGRVITRVHRLRRLKPCRCPSCVTCCAGRASNMRE